MAVRVNYGNEGRTRSEGQSSDKQKGSGLDPRPLAFKKEMFERG